MCVCWYRYRREKRLPEGCESLRTGCEGRWLTRYRTIRETKGENNLYTNISDARDSSTVRFCTFSLFCTRRRLGPTSSLQSLCFLPSPSSRSLCTSPPHYRGHGARLSSTSPSSTSSSTTTGSTGSPGRLDTRARRATATPSTRQHRVRRPLPPSSRFSYSTSTTSTTIT